MEDKRKIFQSLGEEKAYPIIKQIAEKYSYQVETQYELIEKDQFIKCIPDFMLLKPNYQKVAIFIDGYYYHKKHPRLTTRMEKRHPSYKIMIRDKNNELTDQIYNRFENRMQEPIKYFGFLERYYKELLGMPNPKTSPITIVTEANELEKKFEFIDIQDYSKTDITIVEKDIEDNDYLEKKGIKVLRIEAFNSELNEEKLKYELIEVLDYSSGIIMDDEKQPPFTPPLKSGGFSGRY